MEPIIFCPTCDELLLQAALCPNCGWRRPGPDDLLGKLHSSWPPLSLAQRLDVQAVPLLVGPLAIVATEGGELLAINLRQRIISWRYNGPEGVVLHALAANESHVFVCPTDADGQRIRTHQLVALELASGTPAWSYESGLTACSRPTIARGRLIFSAADEQLHCLDPATGEVLWHVPQGAWGEVAPAIDTTGVITGGRKNALIARSLVDGSLLWKYESERRSWFNYQILLHHEVVIAECDDGHLYGLNRTDGSLRWAVKPERDDTYTSRPAATDDIVVIGSRLYYQQEDKQLPAYGLVAYDVATGKERWRAFTTQKVTVRPLIVADTIFAMANDGRCVALNGADGRTLWSLEGFGGCYALPGVLDDMLIIVQRDGTLQSICWRMPDPPLAPEHHLARGEIAEAAAAYALAGNLLQAARLYSNPLERHQGAARLYTRAEYYQEAGAEWEAAGLLTRARDCYRSANALADLARVQIELNEKLEAARTYEKAELFERAAELFQENGQLLSAARAYERAELLNKAAPLYEEVGERLLAARLYFASDEPDKAQAIWEDLGAWEAAVETLVGHDKLLAAAQLLEQHDQLERAAELFEQAHDITSALLARSKLAQWELVAKLALQLGDYKQAADAFQQLGEIRSAASAYEQAADKLVTAQSVDKRLIASLFEKAAQLYTTIGDERQSEICQYKAVRDGALPSLTLRLEPHEPLVGKGWRRLKFSIQNNGFGAAYALHVEINGRFVIDHQETSELPHILIPATQRQLSISIQPKEGEIGQVPLGITIEYADEHQIVRRMSERFYLDVHAQASGNTPVSEQVVPVALPSRVDEVVLTLDFQGQGSESKIEWRSSVSKTTLFSTFTAPYQGEDLLLINRALNNLQASTEALSRKDFENLRRLRIPVAADNQLDHSFHRSIGLELYRAIFEDKLAYSPFFEARNAAISRGVTLQIQLHFAPKDVELAALPWELLWDAQDETPLFAHDCDLTRHLKLAKAPRSLPPRQGPLTIMVITPRAGVDEPIRERERRNRHTIWKPLLDSGKVKMDEIARATRQEIIDRLKREPKPDVIHFVGHGYYQNHTGYIILDSEDDNWDHVEVDKMTSWLSQARLILLNACESGNVGIEQLLTNVAPAISAAGAPAVIAMQLRIRVEAALQFNKALYEALAEGKALQKAMAEARRVLFSMSKDNASWYVPTLTLRTREDGPFYI
jgi:outer membrane protein assembly factor BamB/tetratricopeptide (TPR) repeat protein